MHGHLCTGYAYLRTETQPVVTGTSRWSDRNNERSQVTQFSSRRTTMSKTPRSTLAIGAMATAAAFAVTATLIAPYFIKSLKGERRSNKQLPSGKRKNETDIPKGQHGRELLVDVNNDDNNNNVVKIPFVSFPWQTTKPSMSDISRYAGNVTISTSPSRRGQPSSVDDANRNRTSKAKITTNNTNGSTESSSSLQDIMATMTFAYSKLRAPSCPCCQ